MSTSLETIADRVAVRRSGKHRWLFRPPIMDLSLDEFKEGMVLYSHHVFFQTYSYIGLTKYVILGPCHDDKEFLRVNRIPIGTGGHNGRVTNKYWKDLNDSYMMIPSEYYQVLDGLSIPEELKYEVFLYLY